MVLIALVAVALHIAPILLLAALLAIVIAIRGWMADNARVRAGLWPAVIAFVDGITDPVQKAYAEVALNDTQEWRRDSPFLTSATAALGLSEEQLDTLFITAKGIQL